MSDKYPKCLYGPDGFDNIADCVTVQNADEEKIVRDAGYYDLSDPKEVSAAVAKKAAEEAAEKAAEEAAKKAAKK